MAGGHWGQERGTNAFALRSVKLAEVVEVSTLLKFISEEMELSGDFLRCELY